MRHKLSVDELSEAIAAERLAEKLRRRVEEHQREIAETCSDICAFNAATNLLGIMQTLLKERRYQEIHEQLVNWEDWASCAVVLIKRIEETSLLIKGFCEFFEKTNHILEKIVDE